MTGESNTGPAEPVVLADIHSERAVLAASLADNRIVERLQIDAEDFWDASNSRIWAAIVQIVRRGESASVAVLAAALPDLQRYVALLPDIGGAPAEQAALTVRDFAVRRQMLAIANRLLEATGDTTKPAAEIVSGFIGEAAKLQVGRKPLSNRDVVLQVVENLDRPLQIYPTGIHELDIAMNGGLVAGKLYGFGARKKVGKTILLGSISFNLNLSGVPHLFVSLEMTPEEIEQRNIGRAKNFNSATFLHRPAWLRQSVQQWAHDTPNNVLYEHCPGASFNELRGIVSRAQLLGIKGVIVDYLQLVGGKASKDTEAAHQGNVAQWLADLTRKTGLWIICAAQLNQDDNVRGGEGLLLAVDQYYSIHREKEDKGAWLEMMESRYTEYRHVGSETIPGVFLRRAGPHFSHIPPNVDEWPHQ